MCRKQAGIAIGRLCDKCDGKCPVCDSYVRPTTLVRICDECSFGNYQNKCVVCGGEVCLYHKLELSEMLTFTIGYFGCILLLRVYTTGERQGWMPKDHKSRIVKDGPVLPKEEFSKSLAALGLAGYQGYLVP
jgi:hypothetical protein